MTQKLPAYIEHTVPQGLTPFVRRILSLDFPEHRAVTIPARPTGQIYIGLVARGACMASASGARFAGRAYSGHISGQLTAFDADYTLEGPAHHVLAEMTATGAYRLLKRDMAELQNQVEFFDVAPHGQVPIDRLHELLGALAKEAADEIPLIARAAQIIEDHKGALAIQDLAGELGMSQRNLLRSFTTVVGIAPKPFAMIKRTLFALSKLAENPKADLADIVYEAGFSDQSHLTKIFQLYLRSTPRKLALDNDGILTSIVSRA